LPAEPALEAAHGLQNVQILAGAIGRIGSRTYTGTGMLDTVIHTKVGDIAEIRGIGNGHGLAKLTHQACRRGTDVVRAARHKKAADEISSHQRQ